MRVVSLRPNLIALSIPINMLVIAFIPRCPERYSIGLGLLEYIPILKAASRHKVSARKISGSSGTRGGCGLDSWF